MAWSNDLLVLAKLALSVFLASLIGLERELAGKPAGMRTHMLMAAAATLLVALGNVIVLHFSRPEDLTTDPIRMIEAIIVGVSFLGAGTIFRREGEQVVEGLTTGASLLVVAAIGIGVALEQYVLSAGATALILVINRGMIGVEAWLVRRLQ
jgi:putative Mg2+ transporter-C (MgtC) family protein